MAAPKLVFASANGQTSIRALFDQPMRTLGDTAPEDPQNPTLWSTGGGLPAITDVNRVSDVEYELVLASPAPLAGGYTVTVAGTVESAAGEVIDPGFVTSPAFAVTVADLIVASITWSTTAEFDITFSEPIATIMFDEYSEVVQFLAQDNGREPAIVGVNQSGAVLTVTLEAAGTAGASYIIALNREVFVSLATNVTLRSGEEEQPAFGQGAAPSIAALTVVEDSLEATSSEVLGVYPTTSGWPLSHGLYDATPGDLGRDTPLELGATDAVLRAPGASFELGASVTFSLVKTLRTVDVDSSWLAQASSVVGSGAETVGVGTITFDKLAGTPYEVVFSGGTDSLVRAGRELMTTMDVSFTAGPTSFPLIAFTLLNTQASIVIEKTTTDMAVVKLFRGNQDLGLVSEEFDPTVPFALTITDATSDSEGFLAVRINGEVVMGAPAKDLLDDLLINASAGATAVALTLGSPAAPAETFSIDFTTDLTAQTYLSTGLLGRTSKDLFDLSLSSSVVVVGVGSSPTTGGYEGTGKAAFGIHAEYAESVDAIQVVIGLNEEAQPAQFTGSVSLLTGNEQVLDQVLFDESYVLVGGNELFVVFLHPKTWAGCLVGVALNIAGVDYSAVAPVTLVGDTSTVAELVQQPSKWYHARVQSTTGAANVADFGPAAIIQTP